MIKVSTVVMHKKIGGSFLLKFLCPSLITHHPITHSNYLLFLQLQYHQLKYFLHVRSCFSRYFNHLYLLFLLEPTDLFQVLRVCDSEQIGFVGDKEDDGVGRSVIAE
jgi:hypothetical protein